MKARRKGTNDEWQEVKYVQLEGADILYKDEHMEFQYDPLSTEIKSYDQLVEEEHWQDVRERAAIAAMQALCTHRGIVYLNGEIENNVSVAITYADELVKQLKGK